VSDLKDHDPNEGEWIAFNLMTGIVGIEPSPILPASHRHGYKPVEVALHTALRLWQERQAREAAERLEAWLKADADDNPNLVRGYN
jgi:hypothetical protein